MNLIMTLLVRDEQDIIRSNLEFHLAQGVDHFIVTDNLSRDRTPRIIAEYVDRGLATLIHEPSDDYSQAVWVTRMARAAHERDPDAWVIHNDADEFWWPGLGRSLRDYLATVPEDVVALEAPRHNFVPLADEPDDPTRFWEAMRWRETRSLNSVGLPLPPKVCHRARAEIEVAQGNHAVSLGGEVVDAAASEIEILHFPMRSYRQYRNKIALGGAAYARNTRLPKAVGSTWRKAYEDLGAGQLDTRYREQTFDGARIEAGLAGGELLDDPRLAHFLGARTAPPERRRLLPWRRRTAPSRGLIVLSDANYFPGVRMLYHSAQAAVPVDVLLYDLGLSDAQREEARRTMPRLRIAPIPVDPVIEAIRTGLDGPALGKATKRVWPLWICPFLIADSPFLHTLWVDADMLVLRDLDRLFELVAERPVFTPENLAPDRTPNPPRLFELLGPDTPGKQPLINAGLSGWDLVRDRALLSDYCHAVRVALAEPDVREAIAWHDQGCLIWSLVNGDRQDCVLDTTAFNRCVAKTSLKDWRFEWSPAALEHARREAPEVAILHWNGVPVPWEPPTPEPTA